MATQHITKTLNGIETARMFETVAALKNAPALGRFEFRAENQWAGGAVNRTKIQGFFGAGREDDSRKTPFVYTNAEPPVLLGKNESANPAEFLLHALAGCMTTTTVLHAAARGIGIRSIETHLEGDVDLRGLLGLADVRPGFEEIRVKMEIEADCSPEELDDLMRTARGHSSLYDTISHPVPVKLEWSSPAKPAA